jgi:hypothetical protein
MVVTFKVIPDSICNQWIGWFGESVIKLRITNSKLQAEQGLKDFIQSDLGILPTDMKFISKTDQNMFTYEFPDVAWELFLTIIDK